MWLVPAFGLLGVVVATDLVVLEIAGEFGGALLLEQPLEPAPRRVAHLLAATLGEIQVFNDLIEIDVAVLGDGLIGLFVFEIVRFGLLSHAGYQAGLRAIDGPNLNQIPRRLQCRTL